MPPATKGNLLAATRRGIGFLIAAILLYAAFVSTESVRGQEGGWTLSGTVSIQGVDSSNFAAFNPSLQLTPLSPNGTSISDNISDTGFFQHPGISRGIYDLEFFADGTLGARFSAIDINDDVTLGEIQLRGGDVTGDNSVNSADIEQLVDQFGGAGPGDLNGDGVINVLDISIANSNLDQSGPVIASDPNAPLATAPDITVFECDRDTILVGETVNCNASATGSGPFDSFEWTAGGAGAQPVSGSGSEFSSTFSSAGTGTITLTVINVVGSDTESQNINVVNLADTLIVDTVVDEQDGSCIDGDCSLRDAVELANSNPGADGITFDPAIFGETIDLSLGTLNLTGGQTTIDGVGADVTVNGSSQESGVIFGLPSAGNVIRGLEITGAPSSSNLGAVYVTGPDNVVQGNRIVGNSGDGVFIFESTAENNHIDANVISGNGLDGIFLWGIEEFSPDGTLITNNFIGVDSDGTTPMGNGGNGIGSGFDIIDTQITGNTIAHNGGDGVAVEGTIVGNTIHANENAGVRIQTIQVLVDDNIITDNNFGVVISGPDATVRNNTIQGNNVGIQIRSVGAIVEANLVTQNTVGADISGSNNQLQQNDIISNLNSGIVVGESGNASNTVINGNWISDNGLHGVELIASDDLLTNTTITNNHIGTTADGVGGFGNGGAGIFANAPEEMSGTRIGGQFDEGNIIAFNEGHGIQYSSSTSPSDVTGNSIHSNGGLGISVPGAPPRPAIDDASPGSLTISASGYQPSSQIGFEIFINDVCDPSGFGEGQQLLTGILAFADPGGNVTLTENNLAIGLGDLITVTATGQSGTSEFSECAEVTDDVRPDNFGTEFILGFPANIDAVNFDQNLFVAVFSETGDNVTVSVPGSSFSVTETVGAGQIFLIGVDIEDEAGTFSSGTIEDKGILVESENDISVAGFDQVRGNTDAFLGLPTDALGKEYIVTSYPYCCTVGPQPGVPGRSQLLIVGTRDQTEVTITPRLEGEPSRRTIGGEDVGPLQHGVPEVVMLDRFETLQIEVDGGIDLSGTMISSSSPVAVFAGNRCGPQDGQMSFDCNYLVEQMVPTSRWGTTFYAPQPALVTEPQQFRIVASEDQTEVSINGSVVANLSRGEVLDRFTSFSQFITANKPISVTHFIVNDPVEIGEDFGPIMVTIPPEISFSNDYRFASLPDIDASQPEQWLATFDKYVNIVAPTAETAGIQVSVQGQVIAINPGAWVQVGNSNYSSVQVSVPTGAIRVTHADSDVNFGAYIYGYDDADGYGYPGSM